MSQAPAATRRFPAWLPWTLRLAVVAGLAAYILHELDFSKVGENLGRLPLRIFAFALLLQALGQFLLALRWKILLRDPAVPFLDCLAFIGMGASMNLVSPSGLLSDGAISYWMGRRNHNVIRSMSTLLASRLIGVGSMILFFAVALPGHLWAFHRLSIAWAPAKIAFAAIAAIALIAAAVLAYRNRRRVLDLLHQSLPFLRSPGVLTLAMALSIGIHTCQFLILYMGFRAMDIPIRYMDILFFSPVMTLIGMVPISIGGVGVRESLSIFFYTLLPGVHKEQLLAHAGYGYVVLGMMALVNLVVVFAVLGRRGKDGAGKAEATADAG